MIRVLRAEHVTCPKCTRGPCAAATVKRVRTTPRYDDYEYTPYKGGCPYLSGALRPDEPLPQDRRALEAPAETPPHRVDATTAALAREERRGWA